MAHGFFCFFVLNVISQFWQRTHLYTVNSSTFILGKANSVYYKCCRRKSFHLNIILLAVSHWLIYNTETPQWLILVQYTYMAELKWMISQRRSKACLYVSVSSFLVGTQAKCLGFVSSSIFSIFSAISGDIPKTNKLMLKMLGISYASNFFCTKVVFCLKEIRLLLTIFYLKPKKTSWKHNSYYKSSYGELEHKVSWMFFILVSKWPLLLTRIWSHNTRVRNDLKFTIKIVYIVE